MTATECDKRLSAAGCGGGNDRKMEVGVGGNDQMRLKYGMNVGAENGRLSSPPLDVGVDHQFLAPSEQVSTY